MRSALLESLKHPSVLWILGIAILLAALNSAPGMRERYDRIDFSAYYAWALAARRGMNPYTQDVSPIADSLLLRIGDFDRADYPPTFILCFEPLTLLSPQSAYLVWIGLTIVMLGGALYLLLGRDSGLEPRVGMALAGISIFFLPLQTHFYFGQSQILILLILVCMMRWLSRGQDAVAGLALASAVLLKVFPILLVGYLVLRRRWRAVYYTGLGIIVGGVLTMALFGVSRTLTFADRLAIMGSHQWLVEQHLSNELNVALDGFILRLFDYAAGGHLSTALEPARNFVVVGAELLVLAISVRATTSTASKSYGFEPAFGLWVVLSILLSPTSWVHYLVLLLIPFALVAIGENRGRASRRTAALALASFLWPALLQLSFELALSMYGGLPEALRRPFILANGSTICLLLAYASAYWLTVDPAPTPPTIEEKQKPSKVRVSHRASTARMDGN